MGGSIPAIQGTRPAECYLRGGQRVGGRAGGTDLMRAWVGGHRDGVKAEQGEGT